MSTAVFVNQDEVKLLGKNQDVPYDGAFFFTNKRGVHKTAMIMPPDRPMQWVSKYGSVTVSQVSKEFPNGGMNEAGLVVEQTTLWKSSYPEPKDLPVIGELQWIQLMLDTCATVEEAKNKATCIQIVNPLSRLHYMICDRTGKCAIFESIYGELSIYFEESLPVKVMANTPYLEAFKKFKDPEQKREKERSDYELNSMKRFTRAAELLENSRANVSFVYDVLQSIKREDTAFSLVYDIDQLKIYFTSNRFPGRKEICFQQINFATTEIMINLQQNNEISHVIYNTDLNRTIVESFFHDPVLSAAFKWEINEEMITYMAGYPESFKLI
ncbi:hypothetical protein J45TS6_20000 [Paenibacillus sp. J45TS6]|uniref:linear amide C-N hydrolase n=1 Tax=Paenibacillus sp. J45TS6 TaxID=2807196 RepID=UPI001B0B2806|nr:linear amide C-N hydrolase [Paenibacillus sp. J45TS6]GIP43541.1 hypothetical protein J45TS6_20000 [Paenibacillus sp. J45TS6]